MLKIYGSDLSAPAIKVRLLASFLGLEYQWRIMNLKEGEHKQDWFLKINPVGKVPAIDDNGFYLFESNAICRYLADKNNSALYPADVKKRATVDQWVEFINNHINVYLMTLAFNRIFAPRLSRPVNAQGVEDAVKFLKLHFPTIEKQLTAHAFVTGDEISLADIVLFASLEPAELSEVSLDEYPKLKAWRAHLKNQKFYTSCYKAYGEMLKK